MKPLTFAASLLSLPLLMAAPQAAADNIADCEVVLMETIEDESGNGSAQIASYRPAADFIGSVYSGKQDVIMELDGLAIRALLCRRNNVIISETDFKLLATGVPFILSQNFDSSESDLLTYFFKDGQFQYIHKGRELASDSLKTLTAHMADFNSRKDAITAIEEARKIKAAKLSDDATNDKDTVEVEDEGVKGQNKIEDKIEDRIENSSENGIEIVKLNIPAKPEVKENNPPNSIQNPSETLQDNDNKDDDSEEENNTDNNGETE